MELETSILWLTKLTSHLWIPCFASLDSTFLIFGFHAESTWMYTLPETKSKSAWFSQWLEDDPFLLGSGLIFRSEMWVLGCVFTNMFTIVYPYLGNIFPFFLNLNIFQLGGGQKNPTKKPGCFHVESTLPSMVSSITICQLCMPQPRCWKSKPRWKAAELQRWALHLEGFPVEGGWCLECNQRIAFFF